MLWTTPIYRFRIPLQDDNSESEELKEIADLVTEMKLIKHPFSTGLKARKGIEY